MKMLLVNFPEIYSQGLVRLLTEIDASARIESANSIAEGVTKLNFNRFDLVLIDPAGNAVGNPQTLNDIVTKSGACPVVVVAENESSDLLQRLKQDGVSGFVARTETADTLKRVVRAVLVKSRHRVQRPSHVADRLPDEVRQGDARVVGNRAESLTPRQLQVLRSLAQGKPNKVIARDLDVSENTVKAHLKAVFRILGARNRTEAVTRATQLRIVVH